MEKQEFLRIYNQFQAVNAFTADDWEKAIQAWKPYYDAIISAEGLPIEKWLKNPDDYLPDFLDTKEQKFGHARIGNYDQVMIYQYTGKDKDRQDKYYDAYTDKKKPLDLLEDVSASYKNRIQSLLRDIAKASNVDEIYNLEKSDDYEDFVSKQILRKITILCSVMDDCPYQHAFTWFFNKDVLENLAKILEVDVSSKDTFLQINYKVYEKAKDFAGITKDSRKEDYIKLYYFLQFFGNTSFHTAELSDFINNNLVFSGAPGTGKTYGVLTGIQKLQSIDPDTYKTSKYVQFHPVFSYQDFIEGIKPVGISANGNVNLAVVNGVFKEFCIQVKQENEAYYQSLSRKPNPENPGDFKNWPHYYFVVDEINRGNLSNIFGETFTLLEADYRDYDFSGAYTAAGKGLISTVLSGVVAAAGKNELIYKKIGTEAYFGIPFNIHFIGIMNDVDRSIDAFDLALRRRFKWIPKYFEKDVLSDVLISEGYHADSVAEYAASCQALNDFICKSDGEGLKMGKTYEIGHAFFLKIRYTGTGKQKKITVNMKKEVFEHYIAGTLKEYIRLVAEEDAVDSQMKKAAKAFGL